MSEGKSGTYSAPGEGESVWVVGDLITLKLTSEDTGGAFSLFEGAIPPGGGPPPHVQHREDESFYVMEGQFEFLVGEDTIPGGGGLVRPRIQWHPAHVQERGILARQAFGGPRAGGLREVLPRSGRAGNGGILCARGRAGRGKDCGDRPEVWPGDTATPGAVGRFSGTPTIGEPRRTSQRVEKLPWCPIRGRNQLGAHFFNALKPSTHSGE